MKLLKKTKYSLCVLCVGLLCFVAGSAAYAASGTTVSPTSVRFSVSEQKALDDQPVLVKNNTTSVQSYKVGVLDVDTESGTLLPLTSASQNNQKYFTLSISEFTLQPEQSVNIIVSAKNSADLAAGGHYALLSIQQVSTVQPKQTNTIQQSVGVGLFLVKEDGAKRSVVLGSKTLPKVWFYVPKSIEMSVTNNGNTDVVPRGFVSVTKGPTTVSKTSVNENSVLLFEGKSAIYEAKTANSGFLWPGRYAVLQSLRYEGQNDQFISVQNIWYVPYWSTVLVVILLVALPGTIRVKRIRKQQKTVQDIPQIDATPTGAQVGDTEAIEEVKSSTRPVKIATIEDRAATAVRSHVASAKKKPAKSKTAVKPKKSVKKSKKSPAKKSAKIDKNK